MNNAIIRHLAGKHNVGKLTDSEVIDIFIARHEEFDSILDDINATSPCATPQHHLIIGQRGMGKSTILRRIEAELRSDNYCYRFIPMILPEEQHMRIQIDHLSDFWLNCMDALANGLQSDGNDSEAKHLDGIIAALVTSKLPEPDLALACKEALDLAIERTRRRPVLLLDNFTKLLKRLPSHDWVLRTWLQNDTSPLLIGTSIAYPEELSNHNSAFFESFKTHYLRKLIAAEVIHVLRLLALKENRPELLQYLATAQPRLQALHSLTGGNPRTVIYLYQLLVGGLSAQVERDLRRLMDDINAIYEPRLDNLAEQGRTVFTALALIWRPAQAQDLQKKTRLPPGTVSSQLARLEELGIVEKVEIFNSTKIGYQISERIFNIWYLDKSGSRRDSAPVEQLVLFLEAFYGPDTLEIIAENLLEQDNLGEGDLALAFAMAQVLKENAAGNDLRIYAHLSQARLMIRLAKESKKEIEKIMKLSDAPPSSEAFEFVQLERRLMACVPSDCEVSQEYFTNKIIRSIPLMLQDSTARAKIAGHGKLNNDQIAALMESCERNDGNFLEKSNSDESTINWLQQRMRKGLITDFKSINEWEATISSIKDIAQINLCNTLIGEDSTLLSIKGSLLQKWIKLTPGDPSPWLQLCEILIKYSSNRTFTKKEFNEIPSFDMDNPSYWFRLGYFLEVLFHKYSEAEIAYRRATQLRPSHAIAWNNLANILADHFNKYEEAELAYKNAIKANPNYAAPWNGLGILYVDYLGKSNDAAAAFDNAMKINPDHHISQTNFVFLLRDYQHKHEEAEDFFAALKKNNKLADIHSLHKGLFAAYKENWGDAKRHFKEAFLHARFVLPPLSRDDWFRSCAILCELGLGARFLDLMDECDAANRMLPLYEALRAHVQGDKGFLHNIPVEVRAVAEKIYDEIAIRHSHLPPRR